MTRLPPLLALLALLGAALPGQDAPVDLRLDAWQRDEVGVGVHLLRHGFDALFGAPQSLAVLDVEAGVRIDVASATERTRTSVIAATADAIAAVNGGFFDTDTGAPKGLVRVDDELLHPANPRQGSMGVDRHGRVHVAAVPAGDWKPMVDALGAGPLLVQDGRIVAPEDKARHPRTALGVRRDGSVVLLVVDGRTDQATGMSYTELASVLVALRCDNAVNLDGGGSSTMWVRGPGIVSHPCDNGRYDADGERAVANAVLVSTPAVVVVDEEAAVGDGATFITVAGGKDAWRGDYAVSAGEAAAAARWTIAAPRPGRYELLARWPRVRERTGHVEVTVAGLTATLDQRHGAGRWQRIALVDASEAPLEMTWRGDDGCVLVLDGVRLVERR